MAAAGVIQPPSMCHGYISNNYSTPGSIIHSNEDSHLPDKDISTLMNSISNLLSKYKMYSNSKDTYVTSGGLQQFISRKLKQRSESANNSAYRSWTERLRAIYTRDPPKTLLLDEEGGGGSLFQCLPIDLKLAIFSRLDSRSLCQACCVCRDWSDVTSDPSLWRRLLAVDSQRWSQVSHLTNPRLYLDMDSDWTYKQIYLKCSPDFQRQLRASTTTFQQVSSVLRAFIPRKVPRVAMMGPGLESSTSGLVRSLLYEESEMFKRVAMFPGQFDGVGGGITLRLPAGHSLHLSVLYSASKQERERRAGVNRLDGHKLLQRVDGEAAGPDVDDTSATSQVYELKPQIRHLCQTLDALIFVIDASQGEAAVSTSLAELQAMMNERRTSPIPVLILSCVHSHSDPRLPVVDVVAALNMSALTQPWLVIDCVTEGLNNVDKGFVWLVEQSQHR